MLDSPPKSQALLAALLGITLGGWACVFDGSALQDRRCGDDSTCPSGTRCVDNFCQAAAPDDLDAGSDDASASSDTSDIDAASDTSDIDAANDTSDTSDIDADAPEDVAPDACPTLATWYRDADGDQWGLAALSRVECDHPGPGWVSEAGDCDDTRSDIYPGAAELCDGADNDCNDLTDDQDPQVLARPVWYPDGDGDGWGNAVAGQLACVGPPGWIRQGQDCDDGDPDVHPDAVEVCDGIDNQCRDGVDEDNAGCPEGTACDGLGCHLPLDSGCSIGAVCVLGSVCVASRCAPTTQDPAVGGQWDFDEGDLRATVGAAMSFRDEQTRTRTRFGSTSALGVPLIGGAEALIMEAPPTSPAMGFLAPHGVLPQRGEARVNQYSVVMDVLFPSGTNNAWRALFQTDLANSSDADLFVQDTGQRGIGIAGSYHGSISTGRWYRIVAVVDLTAQGARLLKYIDGQRVGEQDNVGDVDGRFSLGEALLFFTDDNDETTTVYVNSLQVRTYAMSDAEVALLGGPDAEGIPPTPERP